MDIHLAETLERYSPPSGSVGSHQTLGEILPSSPNQTLGDLVNNYASSEFPSQSNLENSSDSRYLLRWDDDDQPDSVVVPQNQPKEDEVEEDGDENEPLRLSPIATLPYHSSHWAEPWTSGIDVKSRVLEWSQPQPWTCYGDAKPSASRWPEWPSAAATNTMVPDWTDSDPWPLHQEAETEPSPWSLHEETEARPSISIFPAWFVQSKPSLVGAGLANLGNTCFLNAVLQCFTHTVPVVQGLLSCNHAIRCLRGNEGFCVLCAFLDHVELSIASTGGVVSPWNFVNNLSYFSSSFRRFQQEDAHEFLQCFLDRIDICCNDLKSKHMLLSSQDESFVKQVFGGRLVSKLRCCNCDHCSDTYEPLVDLSLEIEDVGSLTSALESFTKVEKIEDPETKFMCESCNEEVSIEKQYMLDKVPSVAAFHLKRFKNNGFFVEKIDKYVGFPLELDLLPYTSGIQNDNVELNYDLYAIVVHIGFSSTSGHYYCFIRSAPDTWYKFDDSKVIRVQEDYVLSQEAYILFYAKRSTLWFSRFMETHKPSVDPNLSYASPKSVLDNVEHICTSSPSTATNNSDANETIDTADRIPTEISGGCRVKVTEDDDSHKMCSPMPLGARRFKSGSSCEEGNTSPPAIRESKYNKQFTSPSVLIESKCNQVFKEVQKNANVTLHTPPRSPSPENDKEGRPEEVFSIARDHVKLADQVSCKRKLNKDLDGPERKEVCKLLKKMPNSRASKFKDVLGKSLSESSRNKKRSRRIESFQDTDASPNACRKPNVKPRVQSLTSAGSFR